MYSARRALAPHSPARALPALILPLLAVSWLAMLLPGAATARDKKKEEAEYQKFLKDLPGQYDNLAQTEGEQGGEHVAMILSIKPLEAQLLGRLVMFVTETAADDPRRVLSQRIWTMDHDKDNNIIQHVYQFKEPARWVNASQDPLLLQSLLPDDLQAMTGCELYWTKSADGFSGVTRPHTCRPASSAEGHLIELSATLAGDDLVLTEQQAGPGGRLPADMSIGSSYQFQRRGG
jgi:CpeT/CpcT family (DUF1001)